MKTHRQNLGSRSMSSTKRCRSLKFNILTCGQSLVHDHVFLRWAGFYIGERLERLERLSPPKISQMAPNWPRCIPSSSRKSSGPSQDHLQAFSSLVGLVDTLVLSFGIVHERDVPTKNLLFGQAAGRKPKSPNQQHWTRLHHVVQHQMPWGP